MEFLDDIGEQVAIKRANATERMRRWRAANPERARANQRRCRAENLEHCRERERLWKQANSERINKAKRVRRKTNPPSEVEKEKDRQRAAAWQKANPEKAKARKAVWGEKNIERVRQRARQWAKDNHCRVIATVKERKLAQAKRTPKWLTNGQRKAMREFYEQAASLELFTGIKYHVDHIVPLRGKLISGLHVPWNLQVLAAQENLNKHNTFEPIISEDK